MSIYKTQTILRGECILCFYLLGSDIEFVLVFTGFRLFICMVQNTTSNLIIFSPLSLTFVLFT